MVSRKNVHFTDSPCVTSIIDRSNLTKEDEAISLPNSVSNMGQMNNLPKIEYPLLPKKKYKENTALKEENANLKKVIANQTESSPSAPKKPLSVERNPPKTSDTHRAPQILNLSTKSFPKNAVVQ